MSNILSDTVEIPSRRQSDLPLMPDPKNNTCAVSLGNISASKRRSYPPGNRMSQKFVRSDFIKIFGAKKNKCSKGRF